MCQNQRFCLFGNSLIYNPILARPKTSEPAHMAKIRKAVVRQEVAGFANRLRLARPKTAEPAHMAG
jgi:hypothetical protein